MKDNTTPRPWTLSTPPGAGLEICAILGMDEKVRNFVEYMVRGDVPVPLFTSVWVQFPSKEYQEMQDANAELIVRAVNSHDELVEALEEAIILLNHLGPGVPPKQQRIIHKHLDNFDAALKKARQ